MLSSSMDNIHTGVNDALTLISLRLFFLSAPLRSNGGRYVLLLFIFYLHLLFIHRSFSKTTQPIHIKFPGIVYSGVV